MFSTCGGLFRGWLRYPQDPPVHDVDSDREDITPEDAAAVLVAMGQAAPGDDEEWGSSSGDDDERSPDNDDETESPDGQSDD